MLPSTVMPTVTTLGRGIATCSPDELEMTVILSVLAAAPDEALDQVAARDATLSSLLDELGVPSADRTTIRATVTEETRYDRQAEAEVRVGYRASAETRVRLHDQGVAGRLMREATGRIDAQVRGPWWRIAPEDPARLEACRLAVADARRRAEAYADAAGLALSALVRLVDSGARGPEPRGTVLAGRSIAVSESVELGVSSGELEVAASVEATFELA